MYFHFLHFKGHFWGLKTVEIYTIYKRTVLLSYNI